MARSISVSLMYAVVIVGGPVLFTSPGEPWWGLEFCRSLFNFSGLPRLNVLFFTVALSNWSSAVGLFLSGSGVSGSLSDSFMYTFFCFDSDFVKRPSGPLGPVPLLLLHSWSKSVIGLLRHFLCIILPFGVVTVCFVPDIAIFGLSVYALSNFDFSVFFLEKEWIVTNSFIVFLCLHRSLVRHTANSAE